MMAESLSPMVRQYLSIKEKHKDAILFFRLGDFYEMFNEDAEVASRELDLVLTGRGMEENRMPMCGIPFHAAENYIARLIGKGYKVAICEQVEDPKEAKGVVKREVVRIITPGTVMENNLLLEKTSNYLLAITQEEEKFGIAYVEASTGEFKATEIDGLEKLRDEIQRILPAEILLSDMLVEKGNIIAGNREENSIPTTAFKDVYDRDTAEERLKAFFKVRSLEVFGLDAVPASWGAAAAILDYLTETQKTTLTHINHITPYHPSQFMFLDASTRRNLELAQTIRDKSFAGSLLWVIDRTKTSMGSRKLLQWVMQPLLERSSIELRLNAVEELFGNALLRAELASLLKKIADIERVTGRIAAASAHARDLMALKESLQLLPHLKSLLAAAQNPLLAQILQLPDFAAVAELISSALVDDPPLALKEGGLIRAGYSPEMDEILAAAREGKNWIARLEDEERKRTGIKSLKVGFTRVFGYYIEVTHANLSQVPENYIRKQTLVNGERFITPELKEKETLILHAEERMKALDYKLFCEVRAKVAESTLSLQKLAQALAEIDVLLSFAESAVENRYCRPQITEGGDIRIIEGRHPVVEKTLGGHAYVPNNVNLQPGDCSFMLITGPNMAGKSTFMRQVALICLMAQVGSFVPAKNAEVGIVDRIFTRIGAMDDIFSGQSTFMMEMTETANILHNATEKSLVVLDEIGRGTATFDGMSIAAAVAEYIHTKIKAKTLFATHYHEITQLADKHAGMKNFNVRVKEAGDQITFLHKVVEGTADKSYGIQVAKLAGLPQAVVQRAKDIYATLEMVENDLGQRKVPTPKVRRFKASSNSADQVSLF